jgi:hypothetical protein
VDQGEREKMLLVVQVVECREQLSASYNNALGSMKKESYNITMTSILAAKFPYDGYNVHHAYSRYRRVQGSRILLILKSGNVLDI